MNSFPRWPALAFGLAVAAVLAGGISFYRNARQHAWHDAEAELQTIAQFKADQLVQWRAERIADGSVIMDSAYLSEGVAAWLETKSPAEMEKLLHRLRSTAQHYQYRDVLLADASGQMLLSVTDHSDRIHGEEVQALGTALRERRAVLSDLQPGDGEIPVHLSVIAPILAVGGETNEPLGAVILQCDAEQYLYPLIQSWPVPSASGETTFVRRDGNDVLFLSELRFQKDTALNLRIPLTRTNVPAVMAVLGKTGIVQGTDYHGAEVLSFLLAIPDSSWFLVVKQDTAEVFAPLRQKARATAVVVALLILTLSLAFGFVWHQRVAAQKVHLLNEGLEQRVRERTSELRTSEERYRSIFEDVPVSIWEEDWGGLISIVERLRGLGVVDFRRYFDEHPEVVAEALRAVKILDVNPETVRMFGGEDKKGFLASLETVFATPDTLPGFVGELVALAEGKRVHETEMRLCTVHKDIVHVLLKMIFPPPGAASKTVFVSLMNITERKQAEERFRIAAISLSDVIYEWDLGEKIEWFGDIDGLMGYAPGEFPRTMAGWGATLQPEDLKRVRAGIAAHLRGDAPYEMEYRLTKKDGSCAWWTARGTAIRDAAGKPIRWIGSITDVTERKQAEEALQTSNERFKAIADTSPLAIYLSSGLEQKAQYINPTFVRLFGYTMEEVPSVDVWWPKAYPDETYRQHVAEEWQRKVAEAIATESEIEPMEVVVACKDGSRKNIVWGFKTIGSENWAFGLDITERKLAEEELRVHRDHLEQLVAERTAQIQNQAREQAVILDSIPALVFYKDLENRILRVNQDFANAMGLTREQMEGKSCLELWPAQGEEYWKADQEVMASGTAKRGIIEPLQTTDGTRILRTDKVLFRDENGVITGIIGFSIDITERKLAEERIVKLNQDLLRRTAELEAVNKELEAFSYSVSHDLKAPLRSVDGFAQMLEEDYAERLDDEGRRLLKVVRDSARDMGQLVTDLLTFSRLSRKDLTVARLNLRSMAEDACRQMEQDAAGRTIRWEIGELPPAFGDEATIREVLLNLFANAVKFTRPQQQAVITVEGRVEGDWVRYSVTDNGVGFDMAYKDKLFCVFQRLHTADEFEGTGIGLALVQRIIQRHGGTVSAEGAVDKGARFSFTLPVRGVSSEQ